MPAKRKRLKEARAPYRTRRKPKPETVILAWDDVRKATGPIVLENGGEPVAVVLKYDEYQRLSAARPAPAVSMSEIQSLVDVIAEKFNPDKVILFGSYARGDSRSWSDVDLLVVMDTDKSFNDAAYEVRKTLPDRSYGLDLLVRPQAEIERRISINDWFLKEVVEEEKVLYARDNGGVGGKS